MSLSFSLLMYFVFPKTVCILVKLIFRASYAFQGYFVILLLVGMFCKFVGALHVHSDVRDVSFALSRTSSVSAVLCVTPGCTAQVWRHGARYHRRQDRGWSLLAERSARHCLAGACHRVQLQSNLSSKPEGGQEESAKGNVHLFVQGVSFVMPFSTAALSHRTSTFAETFCDSCLAEEHKETWPSSVVNELSLEGGTT
jgi:hypothetical protein